MSKAKRDEFGDRMKTYENVTRNYLTRRTPVIIRIDGCHFHTFTRGFDKPYDNVLNLSMQDTMLALCRSIQNCVFGYTQSDEITLVLCDYKKLDTAAWFDNNVLKMSSVSASLATLYFNQAFQRRVNEFGEANFEDWNDGATNRAFSSEEIIALHSIDCYAKGIAKGAIFDSRVFNIPKEEVCNCLIWRQNDAIRNSISGLGQHYFSPKVLDGKSSKQILDMLANEKNLNWNDTPLKFQRGSCCIRTNDGWIIDDSIPIFKDDRNYIERFIAFDEE